MIVYKEGRYYIALDSDCGIEEVLCYQKSLIELV